MAYTDPRIREIQEDKALIERQRARIMELTGLLDSAAMLIDSLESDLDDACQLVEDLEDELAGHRENRDMANSMRDAERARLVRRIRELEAALELVAA